MVAVATAATKRLNNLLNISFNQTKTPEVFI